MKPIIGYIVHNRFGVHGYANDPEAKGVLWLGSSNFAATLFKSRRAAKKAIEVTVQYARKHTMNQNSCWVEHDILPVREA